jgi:HSP20 family protein
MGRLFESIDPFTSVRSYRTYPPINVYDTGDRYILCARLPGLGPDEVELTMTGDTLSLRGERKKIEGIKEDSFRRQERPVGRWSRTITLPDRVDSTQVGASFAQGILTITIPKAESAKPRQIAVTAS